MFSCFQHGADYIYLPEKHSDPEDLTKPTVFPYERYTGLTYHAGQAFQPGDHFGCRVRHQNQDRRHEARYSVCTGTTPAIQVQTRVLVQPAQQERDSGFVTPDCDARAPPVTLPAGTLVDFEASGALYTKRAFWALPFLYEEGELPFYKTLIWNYIVQKILWISGSQLLIHSTTSTVKETLKLPDVERVKLTLEEWHCASQKLFVCVMDLVKVAVEKRVVDGSIGPVLHEWLQALIAVGYEEPQLASNNSCSCVSEQIIFHPVDYAQDVFRRSPSKRLYIPVNNVQNIYANHMKTCSTNMNNKFNVKINFTHPWVQFEDVLMIVTYNNPHYETIPHIETLYRPFFPYILHCGPGIPDVTSDRFAGLKKYTFSFYSYGRTKDGHPNGAFNYECVTSAINMHYPVEGYLVIADDMLVSIYKTFDLRRYLAWFVPKEQVKIGDVKKMKECRLGMCDFYSHWNWWEDYRTEIFNLLNRMDKEQYTSPIVNRCYRQLMLLNGGQYRVNGAYSDIYYIPERLSVEFAALADVFLQEDIFLEIAIPTIFRCLENTDDFEQLRGIASWEMERDQAWMSFNKEKFLGKSYLHPTKWSYLVNGNPNFKMMFCDKLLPYLHDRFGRLVD